MNSIIIVLIVVIVVAIGFISKKYFTSSKRQIRRTTNKPSKVLIKEKVTVRAPSTHNHKASNIKSPSSNLTQDHKKTEVTKTDKIDSHKPSPKKTDSKITAKKASIKQEKN